MCVYSDQTRSQINSTVLRLPAIWAINLTSYSRLWFIRTATTEGMSCMDWKVTNTQGRKPICTMGVYVVNTNKYMYIHSMSNNLMHIRNTCSRTIRTYIQMLKYILHSDREVATYVITFVYYFLQNIFCIFMDLHICVHISGIKAYLYMIRILYASSGYDVPSISMNPAFFSQKTWFIFAHFCHVLWHSL